LLCKHRACCREQTTAETSDEEGVLPHCSCGGFEYRRDELGRSVQLLCSVDEKHLKEMVRLVGGTCAEIVERGDNEGGIDSGE